MWISVKDKLPPIETEVLVANSCYIYVGELLDKGYEQYWVENVESLRLDGVTHWQPLPPLPQEENL